MSVHFQKQGKTCRRINQIWLNQWKHRVLQLILGVILTVFLYTGASQTVSIAWNPAQGPLQTYNLYYGTASRTYFTVIPAGTNTEVTVSNLTAGVTHYFAVTTVDEFGLESVFSDELIYLVPSQLNPQIFLTDLDQVYDGTPKNATVTTWPVGLPVVVTYNGVATAPTDPGIYEVVATLDVPVQVVVVSNVLTIAKAQAAVEIDQLQQWFDGAPKPVSVVTMPLGLAVSITYNGLPDPPVQAGTYAVYAQVLDPNYDGVATGSLFIEARDGPAVMLSWPPSSGDVTILQSADLLTWTTIGTVVGGSTNSFLVLGQSVVSFFAAVQTTSQSTGQLTLRIQPISPP